MLSTGDSVEVRGPVGGWFVWRPDDSGAGAAGGGRVGRGTADGDDSGSRRQCSQAPFRLIYSVRTPDDRIYDHELQRRAAEDGGLDDQLHLHRRAPAEQTAAGRADSREDLVSATAGRRSLEPTCYVCGPTGIRRDGGGSA